MNRHQDVLDIALRAAREGAAQLRSMARPVDPDQWGRKGTADYVTRVDRETERAIADALRAALPGSVVLGEELTPDAAPADLLWVVDPLDGTANYLHGYPAYAVSIAAVVEGTPTVGVVVDVTRDLVYHACAGHGAWCGQERLAVSSVDTPTHALIGTGFPFKKPALLPAYLRQFTAILRASGGIRRAGAASLDFADIAQGRFDGFWELYLAPWDVAAGALLVREAGGVVTDLEGQPDVLRHGPFVAGNREIHRWLLEVLRR